MTLLQAGFDILVAFACIDGELHDKEIRVLLDYLKQYFDGSFDEKKEIDFIFNLEADVLAERITGAADLIEHNVTKKEKEEIARYILKIIIADHELKESELMLLNIIEKIWKIDIL